MGKIPIGETVELNPDKLNLSRRRFGEYLGLLAVGSISLSRMVTKVAGEEPEGEPLVQVRGIDGEPKRVVMVHPERKRRIDKINDLNTKEITENHEDVQRIKTIQLGEEEDVERIGLEFIIKESASYSIEDEIEDDVGDLPVRFTYAPKLDADVHVDEVDTVGGDDISIIGGHTCNAVSLHNDGDYELTLIGPAHALPTNEYGAHVNNEDEEHIATVREWDYDVDSYAAELEVDAFDYNPDPYETVAQLPNIDGFWTVSGVQNELSGPGSILCESYGRTEGYRTNHALEYHSTFNHWAGSVHQIEFSIQTSEDGDSGSPWMEYEEPYLVAGHVGLMENSNNDDVDRATVAYPYYEDIDAIRTGGTK